MYTYSAFLKRYFNLLSTVHNNCVLFNNLLRGKRTVGSSRCLWLGKCRVWNTRALCRVEESRGRGPVSCTQSCWRVLCSWLRTAGQPNRGSGASGHQQGRRAVNTSGNFASAVLLWRVRLHSADFPYPHCGQKEMGLSLFTCKYTT